MDELDPRFKIRAPLRCDGIGRLDCAEDLESGMRMAVRWLPLEANGTAAVEACEQLPSHPTLPRIRQIGQMGASAYVAMDFPDGALLATRADEVIDDATLIGITGQIADALASIHSQDVFHGEMSADSVLLVKSPSEKAYLWDMPLVIANRLTDRRGEERLMTQLVKTAPFLAPERARGALASAASDVYGLGAIICIAGGAPLFQADTTLGVVHAVVSGEWVPRVPPTMPEPMRSMVARMVAREPKDRPSAREVAELFMPPAAARATVPEMPAIVVREPDDLRPTVPALTPLSDELVSPGVQLTDNISVSQELHEAGAALLSVEEAALMNRRLPVVVGTLIAVLLVVLAAVVINLARHPSTVQEIVMVEPAAELPPPANVKVNAAPARPVTALQPVAPGAPTPADDELSPLVRPSKRSKRHVARGLVPELTVQDTSAAAPESAPEAAQQADYGFLNEEPELKRPTF
jgi:serine/threonine protein kinase